MPTIVSTLFVLFTLLSGCASVTDPPTNDNGFFVGSVGNAEYDAEVSPESALLHVVGTDASLTLEAITADPRPADLLAEHPELGKNEIDFRVMDGSGTPFIMGFGGDYLAEPSWETDYEDSIGAEVDPVDREAHYALLGNAATAINAILDEGATGFPLDALSGITASRFAEWRDGILASDGVGDGNLPEEPSVGVPPPAVTYRHYAYIYYASRWWGTYDHSVTRVIAMNSTGATCISELSYANHGDYYYESGLSYVCGRYWSGRASSSLSYAFPYSGSDTSYRDTGGGCSTTYDIRSGYHVCNDDTYAEYGNVKLGASYTWSACSDSIMNTYVDGCF